MLSLLIRQTKPLFYSAIVLSVLMGLANVSLVSLINEILNSTEAARGQWLLGFAVVAVLSLVTHTASLMLFERLGHGAQAKLREYVAQGAVAASYQHLERVGEARIKLALTDHCLAVAEFYVSLPRILSNAVVVLGCLTYMAFLSLPLFGMACGLLLFGVLGYLFVHSRALRYLQRASKEQDSLFGHFESLTGGAKELRLNVRKRAIFADAVLGKSIHSVRDDRIRGMSIFVMLTSWGKFLMYAFIGFVMFRLAAEVAEVKVMTGFALLFLFMMAPLEVLLMHIPRLNFSMIAASRIDEVCDELVDEERPAMHMSTEFKGLQLDGVEHRYFHEKSNEFFSLGPVNLSFSPGELVFLVGGNGSGKTTLAKLLVGLYVPENGLIISGGEVIVNDNRDQYRQIFSAVFSDFYLFDQLLEGQDDNLDEMGNSLIEKLNLRHKVQVKDGAFTSRELSQGQRKRLALIVTYMENRPFLLFDEWAADQDPAFKEVFYRELLPELKEQGKTILVISHDDRYFNQADRLLKMEEGQLYEMSSDDFSRLYKKEEDNLCKPAAVS